MNDRKRETPFKFGPTEESCARTVHGTDPDFPPQQFDLWVFVLTHFLKQVSSSLICEHALKCRWRHISYRSPKSLNLRGGGGVSLLFPVTVVTFTWARLFRSCYFYHVGITPQLKCVLSAFRHRGCSPRCLAPWSGEGDISDSASSEPARRAKLYVFCYLLLLLIQRITPNISARGVSFPPLFVGFESAGLLFYL